MKGKPDGFNSYAGGQKRYGMLRTAPNVGPTQDKLGYAQRDRKLATRRNALLQMLKKNQTGNYMSKDSLRFSKSRMGAMK